MVFKGYSELVTGLAPRLVVQLEGADLFRAGRKDIPEAAVLVGVERGVRDMMGCMGAGGVGSSHAPAVSRLKHGPSVSSTRCNLPSQQAPLLPLQRLRKDDANLGGNVYVGLANERPCLMLRPYLVSNCGD